MKLILLFTLPLWLFLLLCSRGQSVVTDYLVGDFYMSTGTSVIDTLNGGYIDTVEDEYNNIIATNEDSVMFVDSGFYFSSDRDDRLYIFTTKFAYKKEITISFWVNLSSKASVTNFPLYFDSNNNGSNRLFLRIRNTGDISLYNDINDQDDGYYLLSSGIDWIDTWHHVVIIINYNIITCYVDNEYKSTATIEPSFGIFSCDGLYLGGDVAANHFDGHFNDINIFTKALTRTQITRLYNMGIGNREIANTNVIIDADTAIVITD